MAWPVILALFPFPFLHPVCSGLCPSSVKTAPLPNFSPYSPPPHTRKPVAQALTRHIPPTKLWSRIAMLLTGLLSTGPWPGCRAVVSYLILLGACLSSNEADLWQTCGDTRIWGHLRVLSLQLVIYSSAQSSQLKSWGAQKAWSNSNARSPADEISAEGTKADWWYKLWGRHMPLFPTFSWSPLRVGCGHLSTSLRSWSPSGSWVMWL